MIIGFDADQDCSDVATDAVDAGAEFVCRYLKNLSIAEANALSAAGLRIVSIFETTAHRALAGAAAGKEDGTFALAQSLSLKQPVATAICATADFDVTLTQQPAVLAYFTAFKAAIADMKLMVYANGAICQATLDSGIADYTWLAGGKAMRGSREFLASGRATIVQDVGDKAGLDLGIDIDSDTATVAEYGGWYLT